MISDEPFSLVYDAIVAELKKQHKNVVSYNTTRQPKQDTLTESDLPELVVVPENANVMQEGVSCGDDVNMTFQIMVKTGKRKVNPGIFPIMWKLLRAYRRLRFGVLDALSFNDRKFVRDITIGTASMDLGAVERGMVGWACLWPITVHMSFDKKDLT